MKLNKKEKNYLLSTLFKGYVIQCAICSVLIFGGTFLLGIMAEVVIIQQKMKFCLVVKHFSIRAEVEQIFRGEVKRQLSDQLKKNC